MEVLLFLSLQLKLQPKSHHYLLRWLCRISFLKNWKINVSHIGTHIFDPAKFLKLFDFENLLKAFSKMLSMISLQCLQVNLALTRLLMSNHSRIFFNISGGKTLLINIKLSSPILAFFDGMSVIFLPLRPEIQRTCWCLQLIHSCNTVIVVSLSRNLYHMGLIAISNVWSFLDSSDNH